MADELPLSDHENEDGENNGLPDDDSDDEVFHFLSHDSILSVKFDFCKSLIFYPLQYCGKRQFFAHKMFWQV